MDKKTAAEQAMKQGWRLQQLRLAAQSIPDDKSFLRWLDRQGYMLPEDAMDLGERLETKDATIADLRRQLADRDDRLITVQRTR